MQPPPHPRHWMVGTETESVGHTDDNVHLPGKVAPSQACCHPTATSGFPVRAAAPAQGRPRSPAGLAGSGDRRPFQPQQTLFCGPWPPARRSFTQQPFTKCQLVRILGYKKRQLWLTKQKGHLLEIHQIVNGMNRSLQKRL